MLKQACALQYQNQIWPWFIPTLKGLNANHSTILHCIIKGTLAEENVLNSIDKNEMGDGPLDYNFKV